MNSFALCLILQFLKLENKLTANANLCPQGHMLRTYYRNIRIKSYAFNFLKVDILCFEKCYISREIASRKDSERLPLTPLTPPSLISANKQLKSLTCCKNKASMCSTTIKNNRLAFMP
jgi:hypothetical protein